MHIECCANAMSGALCDTHETIYVVIRAEFGYLYIHKYYMQDLTHHVDSFCQPSTSTVLPVSPINFQVCWEEMTGYPELCDLLKHA